jgi:hypothetical protein
MRRRFAPFVVILLGGIMSACLRDADPVDVERDPLQVHGVIAAGADSVTVLLSRPAISQEFYRPVSGAEVRIMHNGVAVQLVERTDGRACAVVGRTPIGGGSGCYTAVLPQPVMAGGVYDLEVLAGGTRVTGRTRVPQAVTITGPDNSTYSIDCAPVATGPSGAGSCWGRVAGPPTYELEPLAIVRLEWDEPPGAERIEALFRATGVERHGNTYPGTSCEVEPQTLYRPVEATRGTVRWTVHAIHCHAGPIGVIGWDAIHIDATVAAFDVAYATWIDAVLDRDAARIEKVSAGLNGALGVFGAVNAVRREIELVRISGTWHQN